MICGLDALALVAIVLYMRTGRSDRLEEARVPEPGALLQPSDLSRIAAAEASATETAARAAEELKAADTRFLSVQAAARECLESGKAVLEQESQFRSTRTVLSELSTALTGLRTGSGSLQENTSKIFEIANNLANSTEKAFNLSREVEKKADAMAVELTESLAETEGLFVESKQISDIITIISEIASTTNILSFNASIVAANSGAHGKAFAVVAKEMRKLSESTDESLRKITSIVVTIQRKVKAVSDRIRVVTDGVKDEKESLVAVAGNLQGVMLANEVIRTVSELCAQRASEEFEGFRSIQLNLDSTVRSFESRLSPEQIEGFASDLRRMSEMVEEKKGLPGRDARFPRTGGAMSEFYLLSLGFVLAFCLPLWYDAKRVRNTVRAHDCFCFPSESYSFQASSPRSPSSWPETTPHSRIP